MKSGDDTVHDHVLKAEHFNDLFSTNFVDDVFGVSVLQQLPFVSETLGGFVFTPHIVLNVTNKLPSSTGPDPDGLCYLYL